MDIAGLVLLVLVAGHILNVFLLWLTHYLLHQRVLGIPLYRIHLGAHHRIDHVDEYVLDVSTTIEHMVWGGFTLAASVAYLLLFPFWVAVLLITELLIFAACIYYVHDEYESATASWLERFKWYRHGKACHMLHHSYRPTPGKNDNSSQHQGFRLSVNYCFGGPFTGLLMDRLFGTFLNAPAKKGR